MASRPVGGIISLSKCLSPPRSLTLEDFDHFFNSQHTGTDLWTSGVDTWMSTHTFHHCCSCYIVGYLVLTVYTRHSWCIFDQMSRTNIRPGKFGVYLAGCKLWTVSVQEIPTMKIFLTRYQDISQFICKYANSLYTVIICTFTGRPYKTGTHCGTHIVCSLQTLTSSAVRPASRMSRLTRDTLPLE